MIYTCTMNLAIDLFIQTDHMYPFQVNRTKFSDYQANGKGINVSRILKELAIPSIALGFSAGFTGHFIQSELIKWSIPFNFIETEGINRINVFTQVLSENQEYKLVNKGPQIKKEEIEKLLKLIDNLSEKDMLIISGSCPEGVEKDFFEEIARKSIRQNFRLILDISADYVPDLLGYKPYLLKPNKEEIEAWFNIGPTTVSISCTLAKQLVDKGANQVLLSLGEKGAIYVSNNRIIHCNAPKGKVVNTACAGDTLLATFIGLQEKGVSIEESLKTAVCAASSTAFKAGLTDFSDVDYLKKQVKLVDGGIYNG